MSEKLKPCPFCGGEATVEAITEGWSFPITYAQVTCYNCGSRTKRFWKYRNSIRIAKERAFEAWNRRTK